MDGHSTTVPLALLTFCVTRLSMLLKAVIAYSVIGINLAFGLTMSSKTTLLAFMSTSLTHQPMTYNTTMAKQPWFQPNASNINNLSYAINGSGAFGFIYNSSNNPTEGYGAYNWCNMPHVRSTEYVKPSPEYELKYVELVSDPAWLRLAERLRL